MYPLFFIAPIAIVVIGYMVLHTQGPSSKPIKPTSTDQGWSDIPAVQIDDNSDQGIQVQKHSHQHPHSNQDSNSNSNNCNNVTSTDTSPSSSLSWDSGSSSCSVDSSPSVDTSSY